MPRTKARIPSFLIGGAALLISVQANAQADLEYAPPEVLLLVDSSGSMGLTSVRDPDSPAKYALPECGTYPAVKPVDVTATALGGASTPPDRWTMLVSVLTGTVQGLGCTAQDRGSSEFRDEFALGGTSAGSGLSPYDHHYYMPFNRIVSEPGGGVQCTPAPSWDATIRQALIDDAFSWPTNGTSGPILWRDMSVPYGTGTECSASPQDADGLIDQFNEIARFGLMTFDTLPHWLNGTTKSIGTGILTSTTNAHYQGGVGDTWSYFDNWRTDTTWFSAATGWPGGCLTQNNALLEVGARNPAAPPWEGRLMTFGDPNATASEIIQNNERVKQALLAMRPYGATPIAGMLADAAYFLLNDDTGWGSNGDPYWGGDGDPAVSSTIGAGCRKRFAILLTDGGPNLDLRPDCQLTINGTPGKCPYATPEVSAEVLKNANVPLYVIGFAVTSSGGGTSTCSEIFTADPNACDALTGCTTATCPTGECVYGYCVDTPNEETLSACCKIKGIANKGGTDPFYAEDFGSLYNAFTSILSGIATGTRSRTQPVFAGGDASFSGSGDEDIAGARFLSSFTTPPGDLFQGRLERERYICDVPVTNGPLVPVLEDYDADKGDSFNSNVDGGIATRRIYSVVAAVDTNSKIQSSRSIRPHYSEATGDGLNSFGISAGDSFSKMVTGVGSAFVAQVDARALLGDTTCGGACCWPTPSQPTPSADACRNRFLNLLLGFAAPDADIQFRRDSAFGAIIHSTPVLVNPPGAFLRDESYSKFQDDLSGRPSVLYAGTTDGQLHAFEIQKTTNELNEIWSFIPPAALPSIGNQFPDRYHGSPQILLDGPIVTRDAAGQVTMPGNGRFLRRTATDAADPFSASIRWYTLLLGSFGSGPGFFAMDVTWPDSSTTAPTGYTAGPRFLWQLTEDADGQPLFGVRGARPAIATLFFQMPGEATPAEHVVAILPGGDGGQRSGAFVNTSFNVGDQHVDSPDPRITIRGQTREYVPIDGTDANIRALGGARSLTIVRMDTGEVVRTFRRSAVAADKQAPAGLSTTNRITVAHFDAPIVGELVAYPAGPGSVSDRAFVGDAEGRLWRLDLTSKDPVDWSVSLFADGYPTAGLGLSYGVDDVEAIQTPPIVSVDPIGRVTVAFSTGDQRSVSAAGDHTVWSLTEQLDGTAPASRINWYLDKSNSGTTESGDPQLSDGRRVTGPMSLFNSVLYFTTYDPASENAATCEAGDSYLWGVHYINAGADATSPPDPTTPQVGPVPWLDSVEPIDDVTQPPQASDPANFVRNIYLGPGSVAFGVGITQKPTCFEPQTTGDDSFLGYGTHTAVTNVTPGAFQLVVQSGRVGSGGGSTKVTTRNLIPPGGSAVIDSWAAIVD